MKARESSRHSFNNCLFYRRFLQLHCVLPTPAPYPFNSLMPCQCQGHAMLFKAHQKNHFTIFRIMNELCLRPGSLASWHLPVYTCLWIWHERASKWTAIICMYAVYICIFIILHIYTSGILIACWRSQPTQCDNNLECEFHHTVSQTGWFISETFSAKWTQLTLWQTHNTVQSNKE